LRLSDNLHSVSRVAALVFVALVAAGCGDHTQSKAEKAAMNAEFTRIDYAISTASPRSTAANQPYLEQMTHKYVAATRKYADDLGDDEVTRRLASEAEQLAPWCPGCVEILKQELERY
jgi:thiamine biosynthesis lipoprotein ApbE